MKFNQVIGQQSVKQSLLQMVKRGRFPHAIILNGNFGYGTMPLALAINQYLQCLNPTEVDSCGTCSACLKNKKLIHPDVSFSFPIYGSKENCDHFIGIFRSFILNETTNIYPEWMNVLDAENKQGNINKEECLNILKKSKYQSFESHQKTFIIWKAEFLAKEGNRLLKLIEEPPKNTCFILLVEDLDMLLNTIVSRCQVINIPPVQDHALQDWMNKEGKINREMNIILSEGNIHTLLGFNTEDENNLGATFLDWFRKCFKGNALEIMNWVQSFSKYSREQKKQFTQYALHMMP